MAVLCDSSQDEASRKSMGLEEDLNEADLSRIVTQRICIFESCLKGSLTSATATDLSFAFRVGQYADAWVPNRATEILTKY